MDLASPCLFIYPSVCYDNYLSRLRFRVQFNWLRDFGLSGLGVRSIRV